MRQSPSAAEAFDGVGGVWRSPVAGKDCRGRAVGGVVGHGGHKRGASSKAARSVGQHGVRGPLGPDATSPDPAPNSSGTRCFGSTV